ncbi:putative transcription factor C2C2-Dof family [Lupinus albus]|uniref:Putative transcription factor C2C2-Dof family n=1 Tax=Lupinus albus TaxID=3870 RepID=A0A6A4PN92_LUPAL|nr:putative transcription factor C2C2-Dof family [Lupinus albus]
MGQGQNSEGIKLFGTTITLHGKQRSEDKKVSEDGIEEKKPYLVQDARAWKQSCYFNNYNVNQPRHFCRGCQRY